MEDYDLANPERHCQILIGLSWNDPERKSGKLLSNGVNPPISVPKEWSNMSSIGDGQFMTVTVNHSQNQGGEPLINWGINEMIIQRSKD
jgi:hypothetical protein